MPRSFILRVVPAVLLACAAPLVQAQLLDSVEIRRDGRDAVAAIRFVTPVQMQRTVVSRSGDLVQISYLLLPTSDTLRPLPGERRLAGGGTLPQLAISEEPEGAGSLNQRKLVVRFSAPTRFTVRPGRDRNSIDVVLPGLGDAVPLVPPRPVAPAGLPGRYAINVYRTTRPGEGPTASIPSAFQDNVVFTTRHVVDGQTFYETNVGYFRTEAEAQHALSLLQKLFPGASIVDLQPTAAVVQPAQGQQPGQPPQPAQPAQPPQPAQPAQPAQPPQPGQAPPPAATTAAEIDAQAALLLAQAQAAFDGGNAPVAIPLLNQLLNLPPNASTRRAQLLVGEARLRAGDMEGARREFELFVKLYPDGADSQQARARLAALPPAEARTAQAREPRKIEPVTTTNGSVSLFYFGGRSKIRTQEFDDSPLGGAAALLSDATLSSTDLKQAQTSVDLNWRHRDADRDQRFVVRDSYTADFMPNRPDKNRLSALYYEQRVTGTGTGLRIGRQSPTGYGVLYRFDGVQGSVGIAPKWKVNGVWGMPSDKLLDTHRVFYGLSLEAEALTPELSGNVYVIQQTIDGFVDRRAVGTELRYFKGGLSLSGQLDYDLAFGGLNIATVQGTWQLPDTTVYNVLFDRRTVPLRTLGNMLFFQDPGLAFQPRNMRDLVAATSLAVLRQRANGVTPMQTQATLGFTRPITHNWQGGADLRYTKVDPIPAVPVILPDGQPGTGNLWGAGLQLIGSNLFSVRDTHVFNMTWLTGPTYHGTLFSYNNLTAINGKWQLEPALRYYTQTDNIGTHLRRLTPVLRTLYHMQQQFTVETEITYEMSRSNAPLRAEDANRLFFYFGGRYDF
jgi:tetratricopeptide (TPR) repeat protein